jgi:DNA-binding transcriptional ArsR family regulator
MPDRDPYFAFADSTRRAILRLLWDEGSRPAGDIATSFPEITREAVSRHLRILRETGLIRSEARGRELWYSIDRARLAELHAAFFARFAPAFDASLAALKHRAESDVD